MLINFYQIYLPLNQSSLYSSWESESLYFDDTPINMSVHQRFLFQVKRIIKKLYSRSFHHCWSTPSLPSFAWSARVFSLIFGQSSIAKQILIQKDKIWISLYALFILANTRPIGLFFVIARFFKKSSTFIQSLCFHNHLLRHLISI